MDVLLGCGELGVAHDFLNDAWRNILQGEGCCGGMAAGVWTELSASGLFKNGVILRIEFVLIDADQFSPGVCSHRSDRCITSCNDRII